MVSMVDEQGSRVPSRLLRVFASWDGQSRPSQPGVRWGSASWRTYLPAFSDLFDRLPNPIDRDSAMAHATRASAEGKDTEAFITAMVWGYGRVGYGPFRTARVLTENPDAHRTLGEVAARLRRDGGPEAFAWLVDHRLNWLGVAFATKYLFLCNATPAVPALVLDRLVQAWLRKHADWSVRLDWHSEDYRSYVHAVMAWAVELDISAPEVEYLMFADEIAADPQTQWATTSASIAPVEVNRTADSPDTLAVLEALTEAADAFAALPPGGDPTDADDFDLGLRQLRRIVLSRVS